MEFLKELWDYMRIRKKFWLLPILVALLTVGGLLWLTGGTSMSQFIYTVF